MNHKEAWEELRQKMIKSQKDLRDLLVTTSSDDRVRVDVKLKGYQLAMDHMQDIHKLIDEEDNKSDLGEVITSIDLEKRLCEDLDRLQDLYKEAITSGDAPIGEKDYLAAKISGYRMAKDSILGWVTGKPVVNMDLDKILENVANRNSNKYTSDVYYIFKVSPTRYLAGIEVESGGNCIKFRTADASINAERYRFYDNGFNLIEGDLSYSEICRLLKDNFNYVSIQHHLLIKHNIK